MRNLCTGHKNGHKSVKEIHDSTSSFDLTASVVSQYWKIAGGTGAQCMDLSKFYMLATEMLGLIGQRQVRVLKFSILAVLGERI